MSYIKNKKTGESTKDFRLRTKKFFLTYPQLPHLSNLEEIALSTFEDVFKMNRENFKFLIATEFHKDGHPHLHVYLEFNLPEGIYSATKLDLTIEGKVYHGNYQSVKSQHKSLQYIIKSAVDRDNLNCNFTLPIYKNLYYSNINEHLHAVLLNENEQAAIDLLYTLYPKEAIQKGSVLLGNLGLASLYHYSKLKSAETPKYTLKDFEEISQISEKLIEWLRGEGALTLILYGPSGTGKTELAKALMHERDLKCLFVRDKNALKEFKANYHKAVLFDDIDPDDFTREELIHLIDEENDSQIRVLYGYVMIPADTVRIITTNRVEAYTRFGEPITRRVELVKISKPQFLVHSASAEASSVDIQGTTVPASPSLKVIDMVEKKKRGRPKGSKNKKKAV
jgi:hypothetical protein